MARHNVCVETIINGDNSLKKHWTQYLTRIRYILIQILIGLSAGGIFAWHTFVRDSSQFSFNLSAASILLLIFFIIFSILVIISIIIRRSFIRSMKIRSKLHQIVHDIRDKIVTAEKQTSKNGNGGIEHIQDGFKLFCDHSCNLIRDYIKLLMKYPEVECCIRLVDKMTNHPNDTNVYFATAGRSDGYSADREDTSIPIGANKGIPRYFNEKTQNKGVLLYHDIDVATEEQLFFGTENEQRFPNEIKSLIVAPINGWDGKNKKILGLLYITSRKKGKIDDNYVDPLKMFADMLGMAIPRIVLLCFKGQTFKK